MRALTLLAFAALAAGCTINTPSSVARARAANDLQCPAEQLVVEQKAGNTVATAGCGKAQNYDCTFPSGGSITCVPQGGAPAAGATTPSSLPPPGATVVPRPAPAPEK